MLEEARVLFWKGDEYARALLLYAKALTIHSRLGTEPIIHATCLHNIASCLHHLDELNEAQECCIPSPPHPTHRHPSIPPDRPDPALIPAALR